MFFEYMLILNGFSSGADKLRPKQQIWSPRVFVQPSFYIFEWLKSSQRKNDVSVHKVLLEHSRTHYLCAVCGCSRAAVTEFNRRRDEGVSSCPSNLVF